MFSPDERERYSRQVRLSEWGEAAQARVRAASVLVVGAGGLGSPAALYLAGAGVGRLGIMDPDRVALSNLHRQVLYATSDIGTPKVRAARQRLEGLNPHVEVKTHEAALTPNNALETIRGYDLVLDGTDAFATRYLINDACVIVGVPNVHGSVSAFSGQVLVARPDGPCYRCVFPEPPPPEAAPSCAEAGVIGVLPGLVGVLQAAEALKWISGLGEPLAGRMLLADVLAMRFRDVAVERDPACPVCGDAPTITTITDAVHAIEAACGAFEPMPSISPSAARDRLASGDAPFLLDVRSREERAVSDIGGAHIPLHELASRADELPPPEAGPVLLYCRSGGRSGVAVDLLRRRGYDAADIEGGMQRWAEEIDPSLQVA